MILAVLEKKQGVPLLNQDVYVNVVGGLRPDSTSIDLAVALSVYSSVRGKTPGKRTVAIGEVGLTGDLRSVQNAEKIALEAERLGYQQIIMPAKNAARIKVGGKRFASNGNNADGNSIVGVRTLSDAIKAFRE
jgi:DNA repair protein RadA/Sms